MRWPVCSALVAAFLLLAAGCGGGSTSSTRHWAGIVGIRPGVSLRVAVSHELERQTGASGVVCQPNPPDGKFSCQVRFGRPRAPFRLGVVADGAGQVDIVSCEPSHERAGVSTLCALKVRGHGN